MEAQRNVKALDRYLSPVDVWGMAFGCMVGWGVFAMPGTTFLPVAGPLGTVIALLIGMVIMLIVSRNFTFLMGRSSMTGGVYFYTKKAFGRDHAFLSCWFLCLSYLTIVFLNGTALFLVARTLFSEVVNKGYHYAVAGNEIYLSETLLSVLVLAAVGALFIFAKPFLQRMQTILAIVLLLGVVTTAAFCLPHAFSSGAWKDFGIRGLHPAYAVFSLIIMAPWAFVGFEVTAFDTAHFKFPMKRSRGILVRSILAAAFAYIAMTLISVSAVPDGFGSWQAYIGALGEMEGVLSVPTFMTARAAMGPVGLAIMAVTAVASILTGIIGGYRTTTRVLSTMAEDRILSEKFSRTTYSIVFIMALSILVSLLGRNTLTWFVDLTSFGAIVGFGYTSAAAYKIARMENNRQVKVTGLIGTIISVLFATVQLVPRLAAMEAMDSEAFLLLSLWCLLGFVFYWRTVVRSSLTEYSGMSTSGIALFALLIYSALLWLFKQVMIGETAADMRQSLLWGGIVLMIIVFVGLGVMLYVQNVVREKHEAAEREKIHAVESSLAKSQFLFNMSHDIRTPMNAILGYTNLARQEQDLSQVRAYLDKINGSSQHLLALINDILEMSRIESGKLELEFVPVDLRAVFSGMEDLFFEQMKQKGLAFRVHADAVQHPYVWADRKNLNRVLLNIISNAYKFTPTGGTVTVNLWEAGADGGYGLYEMRVQDTGIGMSKAFAERMFNAFERERTSTVSGVEGTGLGMSITKSIVDLMGGTIEVMTAPGSGTEIVIRLRFRLAKEEEAPRERQAGAPASAAREIDYSTKRLLLVEDNPVNMEIAAMILGQAGFQIETAEDGRVALDKVAASQPGWYDAILMDVQMPGMDGYEATRRIRALENRALACIPILAMTANAFKEDEQAAREAGMQAHIAKPIDVGVMMKTITAVLQAEQDRRANGKGGQEA